MPSIQIRPLQLADRPAWESLWHGYLTFYQTQIPDHVTDETWRRFHDSQVPMWVLGAFSHDQLVGIVHYIFHFSSWTEGPYCYLQDLFTVPDTRGQGVGRALIEAVYNAARIEGASRVYWLTHETNTTAMKLYDNIAERSGFIQYRKILNPDTI